MNGFRKLAIIAIMMLGLASAAAPASAKTFSGDVYLGISLGSMTGLVEGMGLGGLSADMMGQVKLPFRAKVYYQDGMMRLDVELPSTADKDTGNAYAGSSQVFSLLIDYGTYDLTLLNHGNRCAYRLTVPPEMHELILPQDPMVILTSEEFIKAFNQEGVKYIGTKRLKARSFNGLKAEGIEMSFRVLIPEADLAEMKEAGIDFDTVFKLHLYLEEETSFPLLYEIDSSMFRAVFRLINLHRDRLPDVLFEIPAFYTIEEFTVSDIESLINNLAQDFGLTDTFTMPPAEIIGDFAPEEASPVPPRPIVGEDEEDKGTEESEDSKDGGDKTPILPPAMYG
ncbi:MAG TPA: hypothetical protein ENI81_12855 [Phycisphaerales bacterium]|nr:hypothetical protein [Phycisphaerales bacterium]